MLRLTLDMDDVLADTHEKLIDIVLNEFDTIYSREDLMKDSLRNLLHPKQYGKIRNILLSEGFFADIPVKKGAVETVRRLSDYYEIYIATAAMEFPNSFVDKYNWLKKHFDFIDWKNIVFCGDKSIINSDYLIDDHTKNLIPFKGTGILFTAPHNLNVTGFQRVDNWDEVSELFLPHR